MFEFVVKLKLFDHELVVVRKDMGFDARILKEHLIWQETTSAEFPYVANFEGHKLKVRINDFPAEPLYTLFIDEIAVGDIESWPETWTRP